MSIQDLRSKLPEYAKDTKLNLGTILSDQSVEGLNLNQSYGIALASAYSTKNTELIEAVHAEVKNTLSEEEIRASKAASTIMAMNNIYYRFIHLVSDKEYGKLPANLRMQIIGNPGIEKVNFELYSLAVSAINGCGMCMDAHVNEVTKHGISRQGVQSTIRIASVINAAAQAIFIG